jgi:hypothetical protein
VKITFNIGEVTEVLDLSFNNIMDLDNEFFNVNVNVLTSVYLNDNHIRYLEPEVFQRLVALRHLYLQNNSIDSLHPSIFQTNINLTTLDLSGNEIMKIDPNTFEKNQFLSWVNVIRNPLNISYIQPELFSFCINTLNIDICKTPNYSINSFENIPYLKQINRKESKVFTVQSFTTNQNMKLEEISSEINAISELRKMGYFEEDELRYDPEQKVILSAANASVVCYCSRLSAWFWCNEKTLPCANSTAGVYLLLGCNKALATFHTSSPVVKSSQPTLILPSSVPRTTTGATVVHNNRTNVDDSETVSGTNVGGVSVGVVVGVGVVVVVFLIVRKYVPILLRRRRNRNAEGCVEYRRNSINTLEPSTSRSLLDYYNCNVTQENHIYSEPYDSKAT